MGALSTIRNATDLMFAKSAALLFTLLYSLPHVFAATHTVDVIDHEYVPAHITIAEGDTVRWIWKADNHNVVSGVPFTPDGGFESLLTNRGYQFEHIFDRNFVNAFPKTSNRYDYYCFPHAAMGMTGSVTVVRADRDFFATLNSWEVVSDSQSTASGSCLGQLSGDETQLTVRCTHNLGGATALNLHLGYFGTEGASFCNLNSVSAQSATCNVSATQVEELFAGGVYASLASNAYPGGELRGQVLLAGGSHAISGKVLTLNGAALAGVTISDGSRSAITTSTGDYTITSVPNGTYRLTASRGGRTFIAATSSNPLVVLGGAVTNRDFTAYPPGSCGLDADGDGVCNIDETAAGSSNLDPGSYPLNRVRSPAYLLWNGFLEMRNILEIINKSGSALPIIVRLYNVSGAQTAVLNLSVPANGQRDIILNELQGFARDSYGLVRVEFDSPFNDLVEARVFFYRDQGLSGQFEFAFGVSVDKPLYGQAGVLFNTFQPSLDLTESAYQVAQWLSVVNLDSAGAQGFRVDRFDQTGQLISSQRLTVPSFARIDIEAGHQNPGANRVGLHLITPDDVTAPYLAQLYRYGGRGAPGATLNGYTFAFPLIARPGNGNVQTAFISTGAGAANWVELCNVSAQPSTATVEFYSSNGSLLRSQNVSLAARAQRHFDAGEILGSASPAATSGQVLIRPAQANSMLAYSMFYFRDQTSGAMKAMYGTPLRESLAGAVSGSYNLFLGMSNWLKVTNPSSQSTDFRLSIFDLNGSSRNFDASLAPYSGVELGLHQTTVFGTTLDSYGRVEITPQSGGMLNSELLRLRPDANGGVDFAAPTLLR
jgi:plastocyanin